MHEAVKGTELKGGTPPPPPPPVVKTEGAEAEKQPSADEGEEKKDEDKLTEVTNGHNRFVWDLRTVPAKKFENMILWGGSADGPRVLPGTYTAQLTVGDQKMTAPFEVREDPRTTATPADLRVQHDFLVGIRDKFSEVNESITRIREVRRELADVKKRAGKDAKPVIDAANDLDKKMTAIEEALYQTKNKSSQDPLNYPVRLNNKLAAVADSAEIGGWAPTAQHVAVRDEIVKLIDEQLARLKALWATDLPAFNKLAATVPAVK